MRLDIEKRLHRVPIKLEKSDVKCPHANTCKEAENCVRCNEFFEKCSLFNS